MTIRSSLKKLLPDSRSEWIMLLFIVAGVLISGLLIWQLLGINPTEYCRLAEITSPENVSACLAVLVKILEVKDHAVIGLLSILGFTVLSVVVVAMGVKLSGGGPGGVSVDIGADKTDVSVDGKTVATIPTPPSEEPK